MRMGINSKLSLLICTLVLMMCSRNSEDGSVDNSGKDVEHFESKNVNLLELALEANSNYEERKFDIAIKYLDTLIQLDSTNGEYFFKRGFSKAQISDYSSSSIDFREAINKGYKPSLAFFNLGLNESLLGHDSLAIVYLKKSLEIDPKYQRAKDMLNALTKAKSSI